MIQKVGPPSFDTHFTDNVLAGHGLHERKISERKHFYRTSNDVIHVYPWKVDQSLFRCGLLTGDFAKYWSEPHNI